MAGQFENFIGGDWHAGDYYTPNVNPSCTSDVIGEYAHASAEQTQSALAAASAAFPVWSRSGIQQRCEALDFVGTELLSRQHEIGRLLAREEGKTLREAVGEVVRAGQIFKFFAGEAVRASGESIASVRPDVRVEVIREPVGVVGIICPWNFPIAVPAWKIAPALAYGNCVVFKPAELVPGCAWVLAEILSRAGLPPGTFNLVNGRGAVVGTTIATSGLTNAISFTGSTEVGGSLLAQAAPRGVKLQMEMGGKNALVILEDADLDLAVECAIQGSFFSAGQRCTASSRLIVADAIHDRFVTAMVNQMQRLVVGDALDERTQIGPLASAQQLERTLHYAAVAAQEGGVIVEGAKVPAGAAPGYFLRPGLIANTVSSMTINRNEVFGPLASVIRVGSYDEALYVTNETRFGLSAGICTRSLKYAEDFKHHAEVGMVMVNLPTAGVDYHVPFGGRKASSYGPREQGQYAREFYTAVKTTYVRAA